MWEERVNIEYLLQTDAARQRATGLFSLENKFAYGMFFRASFDYSDALLQTQSTVPTLNLRTDTTASSADFTVGLHARHSRVTDNGCDILKPKQCLERILTHRQPHETCRVLLMADHKCTLDKLKNWLVDRNCTGETANHVCGKSWRSEHGPFAGVGYFQDLVLVSQARSGFVSSDRTSSQLVQEIIEYDRLMEV